MSIYDKLVEVRDKISREENPKEWEERANVLVQIVSHAFTNMDSKDEVPKLIHISNCSLSEEHLNELLSEIELNVSKINVAYSYGESNDYVIRF